MLSREVYVHQKNKTGYETKLVNIWIMELTDKLLYSGHNKLCSNLVSSEFARLSTPNGLALYSRLGL